MEDKTLRILTLMEGLEESIDQRVGEDYGHIEVELTNQIVVQHM